MRITEEVKQQFVKSSRAKTERINLPSVFIVKTAQCDIVQFYCEKTVNDFLKNTVQAVKVLLQRKCL